MLLNARHMFLLQRIFLLFSACAYIPTGGNVCQIARYVVAQKDTPDPRSDNSRIGYLMSDSSNIGYRMSGCVCADIQHLIIQTSGIGLCLRQYPMVDLIGPIISYPIVP